MEFTKELLQKWVDNGPKSAMTDAFTYYAGKNEKVVAIGGDLAKSTGIWNFGQEHPDRFFNLGICEQNMAGTVTGIAKEGLIGVMATFATFASMRDLEQLRDGMGYMHLNIKVIGTYGGVSMGTLGNSHYGLEDIAMMRNIPGVAVLAPCDGREICAAVEAMLEYEGPVYLRISGLRGTPAVYGADIDFKIGKANKLADGADGAVIATGSMVSNALQAAKALKEEGVNLKVFDMHTISPLDKEAVLEAAGTGHVFTVEEHFVSGGLGDAVASVMAEAGCGKLTKIGIPFQFLHIGGYADQLKRCGLTAPQIAETIKAAL